MKEHRQRTVNGCLAWRHWWLMFLSFIWFVGSSCIYLPQVVASDLVATINDEAGLLTPEEEQKLDEQISSLRIDKDIWCAIVLPASLQNLSIEHFAADYFALGKFGQKEKDNGLLIVVAMEERRTRIEVGYGLEGLITDAKAMQLIDNHLTPALKRSEVYAGISSVLAALPDARGEFDASVKKTQQIEAQSSRMFYFRLGNILGSLFFFAFGTFTLPFTHLIATHFFWQAFAKAGKEPRTKALERKAKAIHVAIIIGILAFTFAAMPSTKDFGPELFESAFVGMVSLIIVPMVLSFFLLVLMSLILGWLARRNQNKTKSQFYGAYRQRETFSYDNTSFSSGSGRSSGSSGGSRSSSSSSRSSRSSSSSGGGRSGGGGASSSF